MTVISPVYADDGDAAGKDVDVILDPTSQMPFPKSLVSPSGAKLAFVASGVRTVSFLSIRVYAAGFYVNESALQSAKGVQDEQQMRQLLERNDVETSVGKSDSCSCRASELMQVAAVITPLRGTGLSHLRDGFARALMSRLKLPQVSGHLAPERVSVRCSRASRVMKLTPQESNATTG